MADRTISVALGTRSYDIKIGHHSLAQIGKLLRTRFSGSRILVITDHNVARYYLDDVIKSLEKEHFLTSSFLIYPGERSKSFTSACRIYDTLITEGYDSNSCIVALGGGVVGDLAGFTAATYHRGITFCQIPTTLLAQTDASIGGKVAVNHRLGKNLIGAFYQPVFVLIDINSLETLPERHWKNGMAEVIKYAIIKDRNFFEFLEKQSLDKKPDSREVISEIVYTCCKIKSEIVSIDERDESIRKHLNFGHTIGHAVESAAGIGKILHGEAIACGMISASYISWKLGTLKKDEFLRIHNLINSVGLGKSLPSMSLDKFADFLYRDKKRNEKGLKFILVSGIGTSYSVEGIKKSLIFESLKVIKNPI
ncbi:MAG: 3-dehydroquinate synthase [Candidatus Schekmanbacteria bacterium RBG_13_48_7]|uniref:3-dehydroquinate synthase n=1 Tax=Candidatus Schekmanbacteria bacterium RBG_13_48_7 TaxID=1817878 RepID=A0A1F7S577_9BACT|nr:MAG: 3-dehydroquinate synthase [Candidatus Schekmanbacteria bacterium RBG_13_48_7]